MKFNDLANKQLGSVGKPPFIYGTAWKKEKTADLVKEAILSGFTAVDTAAQPRHYREDLVGDALRQVFASGVRTREQIFLQTKFTSPNGQDKNNMPYSATAPLEQQIHSSVASSLQNLRPTESLESIKDTYIDALLLHSPYESVQETITAWKLLETYVPEKIRNLGISNVSLPHLKSLFEAVDTKPAFVQNRFYPATGHDVTLREFCEENGIVYQSFWTLTGNPDLKNSKPVLDLSKDAGVSKEVALYSLVIELGIAPLNGTTNAERMKSDLEDVVRVRNWTNVYGEKWKAIVQEFKNSIGQKGVID